jgi:hypothetical protein
MPAISSADVRQNSPFYRKDSYQSTKPVHFRQRTPSDPGDFFRQKFSAQRNSLDQIEDTKSGTTTFGTKIAQNPSDEAGGTVNTLRIGLQKNWPHSTGNNRHTFGRSSKTVPPSETSPHSPTATTLYYEKNGAEKVVYKKGKPPPFDLLFWERKNEGDKNGWNLEKKNMNYGPHIDRRKQAVDSGVSPAEAFFHAREQHLSSGSSTALPTVSAQNQSINGQQTHFLPSESDLLEVYGREEDPHKSVAVDTPPSQQQKGDLPKLKKQYLPPSSKYHGREGNT